MGVLACDREGCDNIMCNRVSYNYGYICHKCFEELVLSGPTTDIKRFMDTESDPLTITEVEKAKRLFEEEFQLF